MKYNLQLDSTHTDLFLCTVVLNIVMYSISTLSILFSEESLKGKTISQIPVQTAKFCWPLYDNHIIVTTEKECQLIAYQM